MGVGVGILSKNCLQNCVYGVRQWGGGAGGGSDWLILNFGGGCFQFY